MSKIGQISILRGLKEYTDEMVEDGRDGGAAVTRRCAELLEKDENRLLIELPVELGTKLYSVENSCSICFESWDWCCSNPGVLANNAKCITVPIIAERELSLQNLWLIEGYGDRVFKSREEAERRLIKLMGELDWK